MWSTQYEVFPIEIRRLSADHNIKAKEIVRLSISIPYERRLDYLFEIANQELQKCTENGLLKVPKYICYDAGQGNVVYYHIRTQDDEDIFISLGPTWLSTSAVTHVRNTIPHRNAPELGTMYMLDTHYTLDTFADWVKTWHSESCEMAQAISTVASS